MEQDVLIVGAGLAGLSCALRLQEAGVSCRIFEAADAVGGRIRTDSVDGFQLDRGFQVFLTAYPEARQLLDYSKLDLCPFGAGVMVRYGGRFYEMSEPWRRPAAALRTAFNPIGSFQDKLRIARLRLRVQRDQVADQLSGPEQTTWEALRSEGFSAAMLDRFWKPFFGGVFLERELATSSRMFRFVFRMMSAGPASLPSRGMQAIPQQLAGRLPSQWVNLNSLVAEVETGGLRLTSGQRVAGRAVIVACEGPAANRLLKELPAVDSQGVTCLYFAADRSPLARPVLVLNGEGQGPINNLCVPNLVAPAYSPQGQYLVSVSVIGASTDAASLLPQVVAQLREWYGATVHSWRHLRTYVIQHALPAQRTPALQQPQRDVRYSAGIYVCGDHRDNASINGALVSGKRCAEIVLNDLATFNPLSDD